MSELGFLVLSFLAFCITAIAITAIVCGKDKVAEKALSSLSHMAGNFISVSEKVFQQRNNRKTHRAKKDE